MGYFIAATERPRRVEKGDSEENWPERGHTPSGALLARVSVSISAASGPGRAPELSFCPFVPACLVKGPYRVPPWYGHYAAKKRPFTRLVAGITGVSVPRLPATGAAKMTTR